MTPYPPNPPEGAVIRVEDAEFETGVTCVVMPCCGFAFAADHEDDAAETFTCPCCVPSAEALAAADSWWRSRLVSDETARLILDRLAAEGYTLHGWDDSGSAPRALAREIAASLLPVNEPEPCENCAPGGCCCDGQFDRPVNEPECRAPHCWSEYGTSCATCPVNEPETDT